MGIDLELPSGTEIVGELPDGNDCLSRFVSMAYERRQPPAVELEEAREHIGLAVAALQAAVDDPSIDSVGFLGD